MVRLPPWTERSAERRGAGALFANLFHDLFALFLANLGDGVLVETVAADDGADEDNHAGGDDDRGGEADVNAKGGHDEDHHTFVAAYAAWSEHDGADDGAKGFGNHDLGKDFGVTHADADQPVGGDLEETIYDAPHDGVDEDLLVGLGDGEVLIDVHEVGFDGVIVEELTLVAEGEGVHDGVDGGGDDFGEPSDALAAAGDDNDDGDAGDDTYADEGGEADNPPTVARDSAGDEEDDDGDEGLELVGEDSNDIAKDIHETGLADGGAEGFEAPSDVAEASEAATGDGVVDEVKLEGNAGKQPRGDAARGDGGFGDRVNAGDVGVDGLSGLVGWGDLGGRGGLGG